MPFTNLTKAFTIEYSTAPSNDWIDQAEVKLRDLQTNGKTDAIRYNILPSPRFGATRYFLDQATAEDWATFVTNLSAEFNRPIISSSISDI
jgi:hypothetical protein